MKTLLEVKNLTKDSIVAVVGEDQNDIALQKAMENCTLAKPYEIDWVWR